MKLAASWVQCVAQLGAEASIQFLAASRLAVGLSRSAAVGVVAGPN